MAARNTKAKPVKQPESKSKPKKRGPKKVDPMIVFMPKLERYLILGYALSNACDLSGLTRSRVERYYAENRKFRHSIDSLMESPGTKARANIVSSINRGSVEDSWKWLERKNRSEFATRTENTGKDGEPLTTPIEVVFVRKEK